MFHSEQASQGRSMMSSPCAVRQVQKPASENRCMSAASIALEVAEAEGQSVCMAVVLKLAHKKACKLFAEDNLAKSMSYWNHVLVWWV